MEPNFSSNFLIPNYVRFNSHENQQSQFMDQQSEPIIDQDDEALSLCDLATDEHDDPPDNNHLEKRFAADQHQEDFDFSGAGSTLLEHEMCIADDLFFQGHILPLQDSCVISPSTQTRIFTRSVSCSSSGPVSVTSSRSSSTRSQNSRTSIGSSSSTSGSELTGYESTTRKRNQFHSHPSPTPQIRTQTRRFCHTNPRTSSKRWSLLQLGVLKPQEIGLEDLKNRSQRSHGSSSIITDYQKMEKTKQIIPSFGGCKCSADAIESTVSSSKIPIRIPMVKPKLPTTLKKEEMKLPISKERNVGTRKHAVTSSHHRTYEWLKQLSIQDSASL